LELLFVNGNISLENTEEPTNIRRTKINKTES